MAQVTEICKSRLGLIRFYFSKMGSEYAVEEMGISDHDYIVYSVYIWMDSL